MLALALLITGVAAAIVPVRCVGNEVGDRYSCRPIGGNDASLDCGRRVEDRLRVAVVAGGAAGVLALLAFAIERGSGGPRTTKE
jgi:hypothetical protein